MVTLRGRTAEIQGCSYVAEEGSLLEKHGALATRDLIIESAMSPEVTLNCCPLLLRACVLFHMSMK